MSQFLDYVHSLFAAPVDAVQVEQPSAPVEQEPPPEQPITREEAAAALAHAESFEPARLRAHEDAAEMVATLEAKIASLDGEANTAAEDGDASAIEQLEVSLAVKRRLLAVSTRERATAVARLAETRASIAEARAVVVDLALEDQRAEIVAAVAPAAYDLAAAPVRAEIIRARLELENACERLDAIRAEHVAKGVELESIGGEAAIVDGDLPLLLIALDIAGDDPSKLLNVIGDGSPSMLRRSASRGLAFFAAAPLARVVRNVGYGWLEPVALGHRVPSHREVRALRAIVAHAKTISTIAELSAFAVETLMAAHRAHAADEAADDHDAILAMAAHQDLQEQVQQGRRDANERPYAMPSNMSIGLDTPYARD